MMNPDIAPSTSITPLPPLPSIADITSHVEEINGQSFAERTQSCVADIVEGVTEAFIREIADLRQQLNDFEKLLIVQGARTKAGMSSYVELVQDGHQLNALVRQRINEMRATQDNMFARDKLEVV